MAYSNNMTGDNSVEIVFTENSTITELMTAISDFIQSKGWILHDDDANGLGDNKSKVFKAPIFNSTLYKFVNVNIENDGYILLKVYENWDNELHTGINLAYYSDNLAYAQKFDIANGFSLNVYANVRWLGMYSNINSNFGDDTYNMPTFCIEHTRDFVEQTDGDLFPPFVWLNLGLFSDYLIYNYRRLSPVRYGQWVGADAAYQTTANTDFFILIYHTGTVTNLALYRSEVNPITQKTDVSPVRSNGRYGFLTGRFFGLKALARNSATYGDVALIPCDEQYMLEQSGVEKEHNCWTYNNAITFVFPR